MRIPSAENPETLEFIAEGVTLGDSALLVPAEKASMFANEYKCREALRPALAAVALRTTAAQRQYCIYIEEREETDARARFPKLMAYLESHVSPRRVEEYRKRKATSETLFKNGGPKYSRDEIASKAWWRPTYARDSLMRTLVPLNRYIAISRQAKDRTTVIFADSGWVPLDSVIALAVDDDYSYALLQSSVHRTWLSFWSLRSPWVGTLHAFPWPQSATAEGRQRVARLGAMLNETTAPAPPSELASRRPNLEAKADANDSTTAGMIAAIQRNLDAAVMALYGFDQQAPSLEDQVIDYWLEVVREARAGGEFVGWKSNDQQFRLSEWSLPTRRSDDLDAEDKNAFSFED